MAVALRQVATSGVNDFAIKLANVNGTGSSSANSLLMQALFRMGIPVSGKNLFPSNIQGLPTWYEIRANKNGFVGRAETYDLMVAMDSQTYVDDIREVRHGGYVMYDSTWPPDLNLRREEVTFLGIPLAQMCNDNFPSPRGRILMKNIAYSGALVALLGIEMEVIAELLDEKYAGKEKLRESNQRALHLGYDYALANFECPLPFRAQRMNANRDSILIDGNTATALGCLYAGATVAAWYPITPSTGIMDAFTGLCQQYRHDAATGKNNYIVIQAEDELAALGMVLGASWMGARAFTSTSGPGISLMNELLGLAYYTEVPIVLVNVQRTGPSTGMPTRTQQADILLCAYASQGDTKHILLFPGNPAECFDFAVRAFDLAERFQTPVMMLSDLDIGMNDWVVPRLIWDDSYEPDRGRVLDAEDLEKMETFARYGDPDADFVTARTLPGVSAKGAYFARGTGHTSLGLYTEKPDEYQEVVDRLSRKHTAAAAHLPAPAIEGTGSKLALVTLGSCDIGAREAVDVLRGRDIELDYMRVRGFPFGDEVRSFLDKHETIFVVEQNRDAQLRSLLTLETDVEKAKLHSILAYGGFPLSATTVIDRIVEWKER